MKKLIILFMIFISILLVGCVDGDVTLDIDRKGNADVYMKFLTNEYLANSITESEIEKIKENYNIDKVERINESERSGYLLSKNLGNLIEDNTLQVNKEINKLLSINEKKQLFFTTYEITVKLEDILDDNVSDTNKALLEYIGSKTDLNFHLKTPYKLIESNATSVEEENNKMVYNWNYTLSTVDNIYLKFRIINIINIFIGIAVVIIITIIIIFVSKKKRK